MSKFDKYGNSVDPETADALEIVRLLEKVVNTFNIAIYEKDGMYTIHHINTSDEVSIIIGRGDNLLKALQNAIEDLKL